MSVFPIEPAQSRYLWFIVPIAILLVGVLLLLFATVRASRSAAFEVSTDALHLRGDIYGRSIPAERLVTEGVRRVDFAREPDLRPASRRMGTALPGYQAGWFRLRNGEKALLYLTDPGKAVYVPTTNGYSLLLSPGDPQGLVAAIQKLRR